VRRAPLILVAAALVLAACGEPAVGTVVGKSYDDPDRVMHMQRTCSGSGTSKVCSSYPVFSTDPAHYELKIRLDSDHDKTKTVRVDPGTYERTTVGSHYAEDAS